MLPMALWPNAEVPPDKWVTPAGCACRVHESLFSQLVSSFLLFVQFVFSDVMFSLCLLSHKVRFTYGRKGEEGAMFRGGLVRRCARLETPGFGGGIGL